MTTRRLHPGSGNHGLFLAYRIISRCYFHLPVLLLYFWTIDMGMYRIIFLLALYGLTSTFSSGIPGWLLRFLSSRQTVITGELMKALGMALMLWSTRQSEVNLSLLVVSQLLGGAGFTIALTTDAALLRQLTAGDQHRFMQIQTTSQSGMFIATLIAGSLGSILFDYNPQWPFIAAIVVSVISSGCVALIRVQEAEPEPARPVERVSFFAQRGPALLDAVLFHFTRFYAGAVHRLYPVLLYYGECRPAAFRCRAELLYTLVLGGDQNSRTVYRTVWGNGVTGDDKPFYDGGAGAFCQQ
ncbi:hypothetical protein ABC767_03380 [Enterobacter cloacae]